ncbi:MAG TPA: serine/threonine protein phosphatase [Deltaproteobacteria bacterium]|nr:serine/threonine protein phosphatase [Deltaproteobacteria bacterium]
MGINLTPKELERELRERSLESESLIQSLFNCDRRHFLKVSARFAAMAAAAGVIQPHAFQLVDVAYAAASPDANPEVGFRFAYVSDSHLFARGMNHRFAKAALKAVEDVNALDPQPDFVLFGGDLAQDGRPEELELGRQILSGLKPPVKMMVGEHDWYFDLGEKWRQMFGPDRYSFDHKSVHFVVLNSVVEDDFWTVKGYTPEQRMAIVAGLDDGRQSRFKVGEEQRDWLHKDLEKLPKTTPLVVFSHSPLYKYYRPWNFWTDDAEQVQALLFPFKSVTVVHGHTHQLLTNRIRNITFHGMLSTAWPWPYAPQGLPPLTLQMERTDPFDQFDGCGDGSVDVLKSGTVNANYNLWDRNPRTVTYAEVTKGIKGGGPSY